MGRKGIGPDNTVFLFVSFEGPDAYSPAGGSGVRMDGPAKALASMAFPVHLFFIGDRRLRLEEMMRDGRLALHRWCQWISRYYPGGVYGGENEKLRDFNHSVPWFVSERAVKPSARSVIFSPVERTTMIGVTNAERGEIGLDLAPNDEHGRE